MDLEHGKPRKDTLSEIKILSMDFDSPFLVKMIESFQTKTHMILVLEYCGEGDLTSRLPSEPQDTPSLDENVYPLSSFHHSFQYS